MPHGALHHLLPSVLMVFKHIKSIFDDMQHIMRIIIGKGKAIARILVLIVRCYGVLKTTGLLTIGSVPYRIDISWLKPHGSKRDGMRNASQPAYISCAFSSE